MSVIKEMIILSVIALIAYSYCDPIPRDAEAYLNSEDKYETSEANDDDRDILNQQQVDEIMRKISANLKRKDEDASISDESDREIEQKSRFFPRFLLAGILGSSSDEDKNYIPLSRRRRHYWALGKK